MFFGIPQTYFIDIYGFYFEEYMPGYLTRTHLFFPILKKSVCKQGDSCLYWYDISINTRVSGDSYHQ